MITAKMIEDAKVSATHDKKELDRRIKLAVDKYSTNENYLLAGIKRFYTISDSSIIQLLRKLPDMLNEGYLLQPDLCRAENRFYSLTFIKPDALLKEDLRTLRSNITDEYKNEVYQNKLKLEDLVSKAHAQYEEKTQLLADIERMKAVIEA